MATPYEKIYGRFLSRTTDFDLAELDDHTLSEMLKKWLHSAAVNVRSSTPLDARNDENEAFENDLTDLDVELLASIDAQYPFGISIRISVGTKYLSPGLIIIVPCFKSLTISLSTSQSNSLHLIM